MKRTSSIPLFLVVLGTTIIALLLFCACPARCEESEYGNPDEVHEDEWRITGQIVLEGKTVELRAGCAIRPGGRLVMRNSTLLFNGSGDNDSNSFRGLVIDDGGELSLDSTTLDRKDGGSPYYVHAREGSRLVLLDASLERCGAESDYDFREGVYVETADFIIEDSYFHNGYLGLVLLRTGESDGMFYTVFTANEMGLLLRCREDRGDNATVFPVVNCSFFRNRDIGMKTDSSPADIDGCLFKENEIGLLARKKGSELSIDGCRFIDNDYGIWMKNDASAIIRDSEFSGHGKIAIYSVSSDLTVHGDNTFEHNNQDRVEEDRDPGIPFYSLVFLAVIVLVAALVMIVTRKHDKPGPGMTEPRIQEESEEGYDLPSKSRFTEIVKKTSELAREMGEEGDGMKGDEEEGDDEKGDGEKEDGVKGDGEKEDGVKVDGEKEDGVKVDREKGDGEKEDGMNGDGEKEDGMNGDGEKGDDEKVDGVKGDGVKGDD